MDENPSINLNFTNLDLSCTQHQFNDEDEEDLGAPASPVKNNISALQQPLESIDFATNGPSSANTTPTRPSASTIFSPIAETTPMKPEDSEAQTKSSPLIFSSQTQHHFSDDEEMEEGTPVKVTKAASPVKPAEVKAEPQQKLEEEKPVVSQYKHELYSPEAAKRKVSFCMTDTVAPSLNIREMGYSSASPAVSDDEQESKIKSQTQTQTQVEQPKQATVKSQETKKKNDVVVIDDSSPKQVVSQAPMSTTKVRSRKHKLPVKKKQTETVVETVKVTVSKTVLTQNQEEEEESSPAILSPKKKSKSRELKEAVAMAKREAKSKLASPASKNTRLRKKSSEKRRGSSSSSSSAEESEENEYKFEDKKSDSDPSDQDEEEDEEGSDAEGKKNSGWKKKTSTKTSTLKLKPKSKVTTSQKTTSQEKQTHPALFEDFYFLLTSVKDPEIQQAIEKHGGKIFNPETYTPDNDRDPYASLRSSKIVLLAPNYCRTAKYLTALALNAALVKPKWVLDCVKLKKILFPIHEDYLLPTGLFAEEDRQFEICQDDHKDLYPRPFEQGIFHNVNVMIEGDGKFVDLWEKILKAAGAKIHYSEKELYKYDHEKHLCIIFCQGQPTNAMLDRASAHFVQVEPVEAAIMALIEGKLQRPSPTRTINYEDLEARNKQEEATLAAEPKSDFDTNEYYEVPVVSQCKTVSRSRKGRTQKSQSQGVVSQASKVENTPSTSKKTSQVSEEEKQHSEQFEPVVLQPKPKAQPSSKAVSLRDTLKMRQEEAPAEPQWKFEGEPIETVANKKRYSSVLLKRSASEWLKCAVGDVVEVLEKEGTKIFSTIVSIYESHSKAYVEHCMFVHPNELPKSLQDRSQASTPLGKKRLYLSTFEQVASLLQVQRKIKVMSRVPASESELDDDTYYCTDLYVTEKNVIKPVEKPSWNAYKAASTTTESPAAPAKTAPTAASVIQLADSRVKLPPTITLPQCNLGDVTVQPGEIYKLEFAKQERYVRMVNISLDLTSTKLKLGFNLLKHDGLGLAESGIFEEVSSELIVHLSKPNYYIS